jgi:sigma-E factor negative regulatory protein RseB
MPRTAHRSSIGLRLVAAVIAGTSAIWLPAAQAGDAVAASGADARAWLQRMHTAASQRNYQGTLVVTAAGSMSSSRLAHYCEGTQSFERIDMLDGQPRRVYRHNEQVLTLWPALKLARTEQRDAVAVFPAVLSGSMEQLFERYDMLAEAATAWPGSTPRCSCCVRATSTASHSGCGPSAAAACCCGPTCWRSMVTCWRPRRSAK